MPKMLRTVVTLTAGQAAATDAVLAANPNRTTLVAGNATAKAGTIDVDVIGAGEGMPFPAATILAFGGDNASRGGGGGPTCPTDAIYAGGFAAGDKLTFWQA